MQVIWVVCVVADLLPFEQQRNIQLADSFRKPSYGVTSYGSGWRKDVVN